MTYCQIYSLPGLTPYREAMQLQQQLAGQRADGLIPDTLLLLEHPPTITLGRAANPAHLLTPEARLQKRGITVLPVDRGGDITYHAPGQLVGYPILDLKDHGQDLHRYLRDLEEAIIRTLAGFDIRAGRRSGLTGVWVGDTKIAALGIKVARWITRHGFALNIDPDLAPFRRDIVPCGIHDHGVTSLSELLPEQCLMRDDIEPALIAAFCDIFQVSPIFGEVGGIMPLCECG